MYFHSNCIWSSEITLITFIFVEFAVLVLLLVEYVVVVNLTILPTCYILHATFYQGDEMRGHLEAPKAVVFLSNLLALFTICRTPGCHNLIDPSNVNVVEVGAAITVKYTCNASHSGEWHSSPYVGVGRSKVGVINILLSTYSLTCGLNITQVCKFKCRGIQKIFIFACFVSYYIRYSTRLYFFSCWTILEYWTFSFLERRSLSIFSPIYWKSSYGWCGRMFR